MTYRWQVSGTKHIKERTGRPRGPRFREYSLRSTTVLWNQNIQSFCSCQGFWFPARSLSPRIMCENRSSFLSEWLNSCCFCVILSLEAPPWPAAPCCAALRSSTWSSVLALVGFSLMKCRQKRNGDSQRSRRELVPSLLNESPFTKSTLSEQHWLLYRLAPKTP